jgi:hypothetical protein
MAAAVGLPIGTFSARAEPNAVISGLYLQGLAVRPGWPADFATVGEYLAEVRVLAAKVLDSFEGTAWDGAFASLPWLMTDLRAIIPTLGVHGSDGAHIPEDGPSHLLARMADSGTIWICTCADEKDAGVTRDRKGV